MDGPSPDVGRSADGRTMARWQKQALSYIYVIGPAASRCDPSSVHKFRRLLSGISMVPRLTMIVGVLLCRHDAEL